MVLLFHFINIMFNIILAWVTPEATKLIDKSSV